MKPSPSKSVRRRRKKKPPRNWRALLLRVASLGLTAVALAALLAFLLISAWYDLEWGTVLGSPWTCAALLTCLIALVLRLLLALCTLYRRLLRHRRR